MATEPFAPLTRKKRLAARLRRARRAALRPLRRSRLRPDREGPPNLLLIGVDTLRWDHLHLAGYPHPTSPCLDALAARGTTLRDVMAAAPWTLPSFASALTGVTPGLHGASLPGEVRNMDTQLPRQLDPGAVTLARHLSGRGYRTAAFYANQFFGFGLAESFGEHTYVNLPASEVLGVALDWIRRHADRPFFCFVLLNDPHEPTTPAASDLAHFLPDALAEGVPVPTPEDLRALAAWGDGSQPSRHLGLARWPLDDVVRRQRRLKLAIYDATIRGVDRAIGAAAGRLSRWGLDRSTITTVFSDHGEEFLDHAAEAHSWSHDPREVHGVGHGHTQFQELLHVPWVSWGPGVPAGLVWDAPASLCDLAPTLADWIGQPLPLPPAACDGMVGRSLAADLRAGAATTAERWLLAEALAFGPDIVAVRHGHWKLVARRNGRVLGLYDLAEDPREHDDRQHLQPGLVRDLQAHLARWRQTTAASATEPAAPPPAWQDLDDEVRRRLKDLGYGE
jgi:arylsulfatase A-like enzyme